MKAVFGIFLSLMVTIPSVSFAKAFQAGRCEVTQPLVIGGTEFFSVSIGGVRKTPIINFGSVDLLGGRDARIVGKSYVMIPNHNGRGKVVGYEFFNDHGVLMMKVTQTRLYSLDGRLPIPAAGIAVGCVFN